MHKERCWFTLGGASVGTVFGTAVDYVAGWFEGGHLGAATGMAVGASFGYWLCTAFANSE
jgi:hypothetical protein